MRTLLLVAAILLPLCLMGWLVYRSQQKENRLRIHSSETTSRGEDDDPTSLVATRAKRLFVAREREIDVAGETVTVPGRYYFVEQVEKDDRDAFRAHGLVVFANPRPKTRAELDDVLRVTTTDGADAQRAALEAADVGTTLWAGRARLIGGSTLQTTDKADLDQGVRMRWFRRRGARPYELNGDAMQLRFEDDRIVDLESRGRVRLDGPDLRIEGENLVIDSTTGAIAIDQADARITFDSKSKSESESKSTASSSSSRDRRRPMTLTAEERFRFTPDETPMSTKRDLLALMTLGPGKIDVTGGARLGWSGWTLNAARGEILIVEGPPEPTPTTNNPTDPKASPEASPKKPRSRLIVRRAEFFGDIVLATEGGEIRGDHAIATRHEDGVTEVQVDGRIVVVDWWGTKDRTAPPRLHVEAPGPLVLKRPSTLGDEVLEAEATMAGRVVMDLDGGKSKDGRTLAGDMLLLRFARRKSDRVGDDPNRTIVDLRRGKLEGNARLESKTEDLIAPVVHLERRFDDTGRLDREVFWTDGPTTFTTRSTGKDDVVTETQVTGKTSLLLDRATSPLADSYLEVKGDAHLIRRLGRRVVDDIHADQGRVDFRPSGRRGRWIAGGFHLIGSVRGKTDRLRGIEADDVVARRNDGKVTVTGTPARLSWHDHRDRERRFVGRTLVVDEAARRLVAEGDVDATLRFPDLDLWQSDSATALLEETFDDPTPTAEVEWRLRARKVDIDFTVEVDQEKDDAASTINAANPADKPSSGKRRRRLIHFDAEGDVRLENPNRKLYAERIQYDFRTQTGRMTGGSSPVTARFTRRYRGQDFEDQLTSTNVTFSPDFVLLEGPNRVRIHIERARSVEATALRAPTLEPVELDCDGELLLKNDFMSLERRCRLLRGDAARDGIELFCDRATVRMKARPAPTKPTSPDKAAASRGRGILAAVGSIDRIDGFGGVRFRTGTLRGRGDVINYDLTQKKIYLSGTRGAPCEMTLGGLRVQEEFTVYDMTTRRMRGYRGRGRVRPEPGGSKR